MRDLLVIVPSRGRPANARRMLNALHATVEVSTDLVFVLDADDPEIPAYYDLLDGAPVSLLVVTPPAAGAPGGMPHAVNVAASQHWDHYRHLAFMGDDHVPRTRGWDARYVQALWDMGGVGVVYGNDMIQGERIPTQVAMTSNIPRALGYICPPGFRHLYLDNVWKLWGEGIGRIRYLPDVIVEHLHPIAGKARTDAGYERVNSPEVNAADRAAWEAYQRGRWPDADLPLLRALIEGASR